MAEKAFREGGELLVQAAATAGMCQTTCIDVAMSEVTTSQGQNVSYSTCGSADQTGTTSTNRATIPTGKKIFSSVRHLGWHLQPQGRLWVLAIKRIS